MPYKDPLQQKSYQHLWYLRNKTKQIARVRLNEKKTTMEVQQKLKEYLLTHTCIDCGESDWVVLEFDHCRGKKKLAIASMIHRNYSWKIIMKEIKKCDVRCANCHRKKTAKQRNHYRYSSMLVNSV